MYKHKQNGCKPAQLRRKSFRADRPIQRRAKHPQGSQRCVHLYERPRREVLLLDSARLGCKCDSGMSPVLKPTEEPQERFNTSDPRGWSD